MNVWWSGVKGFDPKLERGSSAVFFLTVDGESGAIKLTFPAGIAVLTKGVWQATSKPNKP